MITEVKNVVLNSPHNRQFLADVFFKDDGVEKPVAVFSHGFKGFKDWGAFNLIAEKFAKAGFVFVKFNFSHNGTTIENPTEFTDLEAFGNDNFSIELDDLGVVINWIFSDAFPAKSNTDKSSISLIGHSRGGGISILKAHEDSRITKLCTWASVNEFSKYWTDEELKKIKEDGAVYFTNARTGQKMAIKWQMYENYFANLKRLFVPDAVRALTIPFLIIHGTEDETVPYSAAIEMKSWNTHNELFLIEHSNHNFGGKHPWQNDVLPEDLEDAVKETIDFFKRKY
jgi:dienelactone hydrolase